MNVARLAVAALPLLLAGCSTLSGLNPFGQSGATAPVQIKDVANGAVVAFSALDGLVWEVEARQIAPDTYRLSVKQPTLKSTGQGQAREFFQRRAEGIVAEQKCTGYTILEYHESLVSNFLDIARRVTDGVIRCERPALEH